MADFLMSNDMIYIFRILVASLGGAIVGFEREQRVKVAGLRTHILISMAAALMMVISKYGFFDVIGIDGASVDVSRVAAGIITGAGLLSGGLIFIGKRGNVSGITTAAGIWATIGIGMAFGSGMYIVGIGSVIIVEATQLILHRNLKVYNHPLIVIAVFRINEKGFSYENLVEEMDKLEYKVSQVKLEKKSEGDMLAKLNLYSKAGKDRNTVVAELGAMPSVQNLEIL